MICLKLLFCIDLRVVVVVDVVVVIELLVKLELELAFSKVCSIAVECFVSWLVEQLTMRMDVLGP